MVAGVDPIGQTDETLVQEITNCKEATLNRRVLIVLIVLAASMTGLAPDQMVALLKVIGV
jgi:hypothetical protein